MNEIKTIKAAVVEIKHTEDGRQTFQLPEGFKLPKGKLLVQQDGDRLTFEPVKRRLTLEEALAQMVPLCEEEWPDIDDSDLGPLRDIEL
ncbi:Virulence-associated protein VagC [Devosia crocina]|uniref:Virulence-associated protein VagC n=1 Tax=Devosia crocina TaxID=429728 RepID=A0A1I7NNE6_9HYPH|nr:AbrB/MazE/SpoVT family DNA-binding domain-containing protein [Devosia crocina]SFV36181.1 Virulence-associated protein VagC [Devosia crocina]